MVLNEYEFSGAVDQLKRLLKRYNIELTAIEVASEGQRLDLMRRLIDETPMRAAEGAATSMFNGIIIRSA